jgi:hypothetical protein
MALGALSYLVSLVFVINAFLIRLYKDTLQLPFRLVLLDPKISKNGSFSVHTVVVLQIIFFQILMKLYNLKSIP